MAEFDTNRDGRVVETRRSGGPGWLIALVVVVALVVAAFAFGLVDIDQVKEAKVPDIKVETSGGQAPAFDVNTADVKLGSTQETIETPTIDVGTKESTIEVPTISVDKAGDPDKKN